MSENLEEKKFEDIEPKSLAFDLNESPKEDEPKINDSMNNALMFEVSDVPNHDPAPKSELKIPSESSPADDKSNDDESDLDADETHALSGLPGVRMKSHKDPEMQQMSLLMYAALYPFMSGAKKLDEKKVNDWKKLDSRRTVDAALAETKELSELMNKYKTDELKTLTKFISDTKMSAEQFNHAMLNDSKFRETYKDKIVKQFENIDPNLSYEMDRRRASITKSWEMAERAAQAAGLDITDLRENSLQEVMESSKNLATGVNADGTLKLEEEKTKEMMEKLKEIAIKIAQAIVRVLKLG